MTLIEVIVSVAVLAIIGGVVATAYTVGLAILKPGGPQSRLLGAHSLSILEQSLGQDAARASCVQLPSAGPLGNCSATKFGAVGCPAAHLCFGWPQVSDGSCHVADYDVVGSTTATRKESTYLNGTTTVLTSVPLAREAPVTITIGSVATPSPVGESYPWVKAIPVTITAANIANPPTQTLVLHPVASDPNSSSAAITSGGNPC